MKERMRRNDRNAKVSSDHIFAHATIIAETTGVRRKKTRPPAAYRTDPTGAADFRSHLHLHHIHESWSVVPLVCFAKYRVKTFPRNEMQGEHCFSANFNLLFFLPTTP